jgi:hypothetical protein
MAKAQSRTEAPPEPPPEADAAPDDVTERLVRLIEGRITELEQGAFSEDPTAELGKLSRALAPLQAEQRAKAKAERRAILALTPATIETWIREQTPEVRAKVQRTIAAIDAPSRRSVLA